MKKNAITHWPIWTAALFLVVAAGTVGVIGHFKSAQAAAGDNVTGIYLTDNGQSSADCSHRDQDGPARTANFGSWLGWTGDSDNYDADCVKVFTGTSIPKDRDFRIGLQAQDVNTPCGFLYLFKCGDGGGSVVYGPWVSSWTGKNYVNIWTPYASDADAWDPDQWRIVFQASSTPWYGTSVTDFQLGVQVADTPSGGGCSGQIGAPRYTASSTAGGGWTAWAADNVDNQNFNCMRINLVATTTLNDPTAAFIGTSTAPYGDTINLPWDVEYINTTAGCTITSPQDSTVRPIKANGLGSTTTVPIVGVTTYTLTCPGLKTGTSVVATKVISTISQPASLEFKMDPVSGLSAGDTSTAYITAINAASCSLVGKDLDGNVVDDGTAEGYPYTPPPPSAQSLHQIAGGTVILINAGTTWTVPNDWDNSNNIIEAIGGGGTGGTSDGGWDAGAGAGGGGGYAKAVNVSLTPGLPVTYGIGGTTYLCKNTVCATQSDVVVEALGGGNGVGHVTNGAGGAGGAAGSAVGGMGGGILNPGAPYAYSGGGGGGGTTGGCCGTYGGGGGGGAAGPHGNGGGGGGGGTTYGGAGGAADAGYGGGGGGNVGGGGSGAEWTATTYWNGSIYTPGSYAVGAGGGGGGGQDGSCAASGPGGYYGGGGGGEGNDSCSSGGGRQGMILVSYKPTAPSSATVITLTTSDSGDWVVPDDWNSANNSIELWGAGGGGGGDNTSTNGTAGTNTIFNTTLIARGGSGGSNGSAPVPPLGVAGGTASGGNKINTSGGSSQTSGVATKGAAGGNAPFGGFGGADQTADANGNPGNSPGGGGSGACYNVSGASGCGGGWGGAGGGAGGYVLSQNVALTPGTHITYQVGAGGAGGNGTRIGGVGANGKIVITNNPPPDAADAHKTTHTVNVTTDYTVTCTPYFSGEPTVTKTVRVNLNSCTLNGVPIANGGSDIFYKGTTPPAGHTCDEAGYNGTRTCSGGQLGGDPTYQYATCSEQSDITVKANNLYPSALVRKGANVAISWDGGNSDSCNLTSSSSSGQGNIVKTFTSSQSWTVPGGVTSVQYLVVAGGGGGGGYAYGGGGGGGGMQTGTLSVTPGSLMTVTVGAGGTGGVGTGVKGANGGNSVFGSITSLGGGGGGAYDTGASGLSGGSGGGGSLYAGGTGGAGTPGQGNAAGNGGSYPSLSTTYGGGSGGGGAGGVGGNDVYVSPGTGGAGGPGLASSISGSSVLYAGGGGGGVYLGAATGGAGGTGGGGAGGNPTVPNGVNGTANTGGGGGGTRSGTGGNGGSGIVIVSYDPTSGTSGGLSSTDITGSRAITANQKSVYTLSCTKGPNTQTKSVTVNLVPTVIEI